MFTRAFGLGKKEEEISDSVEFDVHSYLDLLLPNLLISGLTIPVN
jgi:hypothetical protein